MCGDMFDCVFNHCKILVYNTHIQNINCNLSFHSDCKYNYKGQFKSNLNTQGENTPVIVYSMGDPRTIFYRSRWIVDDKNTGKKWNYSKEYISQYELTNNSTFVLHPSDEKPMIRNIGEPLSQYQHGNIKVKKGMLYIGFVYRNVTQALSYDNVRCTRVLEGDFLQRNKDYFSKCDNTYIETMDKRRKIEKSFITHATQKLRAWNWI